MVFGGPSGLPVIQQAFSVDARCAFPLSGAPRVVTAALAGDSGASPVCSISIGNPAGDTGGEVALHLAPIAVSHAIEEVAGRLSPSGPPTAPFASQGGRGRGHRVLASSCGQVGPR